MGSHLIFLPPWGYILSILWGAIWGSFANVVIYRLPAGESIVWPGSRCMSCGHELSAKDNIPILSYIFLKGRCRYCNTSFSSRYAIIESIMAILSFLLYFFSPLNSGEWSTLIFSQYLFNFFFIFVLVILSLIDWDTFILPDVIVVPVILVSLIGSVLIGKNSIETPLWGFLMGYGIFYLTSVLYRLIRKVDGLGLGDAKLLGAIGIFLGPFSITVVILLSSVQGLIFVALARLFKINWPSPKPYSGITEEDDEFNALFENPSGEWKLKPLPFGPFLALSAIEILIFGQYILPNFQKIFMVS